MIIITITTIIMIKQYQQSSLYIIKGNISLRWILQKMSREIWKFISWKTPFGHVASNTQDFRSVQVQLNFPGKSLEERSNLEYYTETLISMIFYLCIPLHLKRSKCHFTKRTPINVWPLILIHFRF